MNNGATIYIDGGPNDFGNITGTINSTQQGTTHKICNWIFEECEGNRVFVCAIKSITAGEEFLINYNLNHVDTNMITMDVVHPKIYPTFY